MKLSKAAATVCCLAAMGALLAPSAKADEWNKKTVITFSGPVEIPGVHLAGFGILPAGTYVFKILDSQSDRHIVQIFSEDQTKIYATILAIPNYRLKATDKTVITFSERPAGEPEALRAWFYPGRNWGEEFVYPKARAMELAKTTNTPVLYSTTELPTEVAESIKTADEPVVQELKRAPIMAVRPTGEEVQLAEVITAPPAEVVTAQPAEVVTAQPAEVVTAQPAEPVVVAAPAEPRVAMAPPTETLPNTASPLPLIGLFGLMALAGAFGVRAIAARRR